MALKEYSGLDDVVLGRMNPPQLDPLSETALEYRVVTIAFLPPEVDRAEALLAKVLQSAAGGMSEGTWVNRFAEYDRLLDALTAAREGGREEHGDGLRPAAGHRGEAPGRTPPGQAQGESQGEQWLRLISPIPTSDRRTAPDCAAPC